METVFEFIKEPPGLSLAQTSSHLVEQLCPASSHSWHMASEASESYVPAWQSEGGRGNGEGEGEGEGGEGEGGGGAGGGSGISGDEGDGGGGLGNGGG